VKTKQLIVASLLVAIGVILPYFTSHMFGIPGVVLLPMHLPVFLIGLLCGAKLGLIGGILTPVLSAMLTGMPPVYPMLPIMMGELGTYGLMSSLVFSKINKVYISMLVAMVAGRAVYGVIFTALLLGATGPFHALTVPAAIATGWPGMVIQLTIVPLIVRRVFRQENVKVIEKVEDLEQAKMYIKNKEFTCIIMYNGKIGQKLKGKGVKPLLQTYENGALNDTQVADKIIGKAAAIILVLAGVRYVYGELMSIAGRDFLERHNVTVEYGRCVEVISNREGNGLCPLEKAVLEIDDLDEGYAAIKATIAELMKVV